MNLIHVISAPSSFYPRLKGLKLTFGDGPDRLYWRSKQAMDYAFMFYYSQGLAQYYLHLEDDVMVMPNALSQIREFIDLRAGKQWGILAFSEWGFIGKLIRDSDLRLIGRYLEKFYNEMPCDWLLLVYLQSRGGIYDNSNSWTKELFRHVGHQSSSLGTWTSHQSTDFSITLPGNSQCALPSNCRISIEFARYFLTCTQQNINKWGLSLLCLKFDSL